jgi:uncharacterized membrane protein
LSAGTRVTVAAMMGLVTMCLVILFGHARLAALAGWDATAAVYVAWVGLSIFHMDAAATKQHAVSENPGRAIADVLLLGASIASLGAVGILLLHTGDAGGIAKAVGIGLSLLASWAVVHTSFALRYAREYYGDPEGGIAFNQHAAPRYLDFAYLAFTIGMTFQVSDTALQSSKFRALALKHALLSYVFGTVIIAATINVLASLSR